MDIIIDNIRRSAEEIHNRARDSYNMDSSTKRNQLALQASEDLYHKEIELRPLVRNPQALRERLQELYNHYQRWEGQFRAWGGDDHSYAEWVHEQSKEAIREAIQKVDKVIQILPLESVRLDLIPVFQGTGGSAGYQKITVRVKKGFAAQDKANSSMEWAAAASAIVSSKFMIISAELKASADFKNEKFYETISNINVETEVTIETNIDFSKPCYLYYPKTTLNCNDGRWATFSSDGLIQSDKPLATLSHSMIDALP